MPPYRLVIFDFDGTLADSFPWFQSVFNDVADRFGFARLSPEEFQELRGLSGREIMARTKVPLWRLPAIVNHMRKEKLAAAGSTPLFAGVPELLASLKAAGVTVAIISSDTEASVRAVMGPVVESVTHFDCGAALFGKAAKFRRMLKRTHVAPSEALSIGDEIRDIEAAREAGIAAAAVGWGYTLPEALTRHAPALMFHSVAAMRAALLP
ncbi:phosphoglycolate phosphatase [Myxococcus stipitatus DSM 14675]|uniref:Phosphoglycolate phosphatase n=1 Tax=Myxococcus stipitatus (strain DSM 14675 / JCM 12634 / Mx s8) TaxID=1278073 RepID=L7UCR1_MYXSD|nr:HAD-IA family hydrolase [Myxococcus stipitatus]AGC44249.1 phosphoglycolate phosphatase [Myxococcus stipitatus DSM 14675]